MEQQHLGFMKTVRKRSRLHPAKSSVVSTSLHKPSPAVPGFLLSRGDSSWGPCSFCLPFGLISLLSHSVAFPPIYCVFVSSDFAFHGCRQFGCCKSEIFGSESLELRMGQVSWKQPGRSQGFEQA